MESDIDASIFDSLRTPPYVIYYVKYYGIVLLFTS